MKGGKYATTLAKIQVGGIFRIRDIPGAHLDELQHGGPKPTETSVTEFCYKSVNSFCEEIIYCYSVILLSLIKI